MSTYVLQKAPPRTVRKVGDPPTELAAVHWRDVALRFRDLLEANIAASLITSGTIATARLGSGTANSTTFLRGDSTWQTISMPSGAPLTKTDDTNVTLTLGGTPATALLVAASLTLGWTGTLAIARGGTGAGSATAAFNGLSPQTTKGDLIVRNTTDSIRLGVGTNGHVLTADSTQASGVKWAAAPGAGGGEANTASNTLTEPFGFFYQKTGIDLEFKSFDVGTGITVTDNTDSYILGIDQASLLLADFGGNIDESRIVVSGPDVFISRSAAGAGVCSEFPFTSQARGLVDDTSYSAMRTTLQLGSTDTVQFAKVNIYGTADEIQNIVRGNATQTSAIWQVQTSAAAPLAQVDNNGLLIAASMSSLSTLTLGTALGIAYGGTGQTTANAAFAALSPMTTRGDLITRNATVPVRLAIGTAGKYLRTDGTDPSWQSIQGSEIGGTLDIANGGTSANTAADAFNNLSPLTTQGDLLTVDFLGDSVALAIGGAGSFLKSDGTDPSWASIAGTDVSGAALTKTDDTNVTLTLGGTPTTALLRAASLTLGWTGSLAIARGGTGQTTQTAAFDALSPLTTRGDMIYRDASNNVRLPKGTDGHVLRMGANDPAWSDADRVVTLASDVAINSGAANLLTDITGLSFSVTSGRTYQFEVWVLYTSSASTCGSRWTFNGPGMTYIWYDSIYTLTATSYTTNAPMTAIQLPASSNATSSVTNGGGNMAYIKGVFRPSGNGTFQVQGAREVNTDTITAKAGSIIRYHELA